MSRYFERELEQLKREFLILSGKVEAHFLRACQAMLNFDVDLASEVRAEDDEIDQMEVDLEESCLQILALYQPFASDLRYIVAVLKINNDLERIGDLSVGVARRTKGMKKHNFTLPEEIKEMTEKVAVMLKNGLNAFVHEDIELARGVVTADEEIDELHDRIYRITKTLISDNEERASDLIRLHTISRNLERVADHITNIAEDVIYYLEGSIIRHKNDPEED